MKHLFSPTNNRDDGIFWPQKPLFKHIHFVRSNYTSHYLQPPMGLWWVWQALLGINWGSRDCKFHWGWKWGSRDDKFFQILVFLIVELLLGCGFQFCNYSFVSPHLATCMAMWLAKTSKYNLSSPDPAHKHWAPCPFFWLPREGDLGNHMGKTENLLTAWLLEASLWKALHWPIYQPLAILKASLIIKSVFTQGFFFFWS